MFRLSSLRRLKENSGFYAGVEIQVTTEREYLNGTLAPHIIGTIGPLNAEEYNKRTEEYNTAVKNENLTTEERKI